MANPSKIEAATGKPAWGQIQGDGRSFGIANIAQRALIRYGDILPLLNGLGLSEECEILLTRGIRNVLADYLGGRIRAQRKADHAEAKEIVASIANRSRRLERDLNRLDNEYLVLLDKERRAIAGRAHVGHYNFVHLVPALATLSDAADRMAESLDSRPEGQPPKTPLDEAVAQLRALAAEFELPIVLSNSGSAPGARRRVSGAGGDLLKALFAKFDPKVRVANLYGALDRSGLKPKGAAKRASRSR